MHILQTPIHAHWIMYIDICMHIHILHMYIHIPHIIIYIGNTASYKHIHTHWIMYIDINIIHICIHIHTLHMYIHIPHITIYIGHTGSYIHTHFIFLWRYPFISINSYKILNSMWSTGETTISEVQSANKECHSYTYILCVYCKHTFLYGPYTY